MKFLLFLLVIYTNYLFVFSQELKRSNNTQSENVQIDTNKTYMSYMVDVQPQFHGGSDSLQDFINHNFKLNKLQSEFEGIISVCFTVNIDGSINSRNIYVEPSPDIFNELFKKLLSKMPKWKPGYKKGIKVNTMICLPFQIQFR